MVWKPLTKTFTKNSITQDAVYINFFYEKKIKLYVPTAIYFTISTASQLSMINFTLIFYYFSSSGSIIDPSQSHTHF